MAFGISTGPGAVLFAAGGAIVFGAIGYWRGDIIAGWIDPPENTLKELRRDVNYAEGLKYRDITIPVGATDSQYTFRNNALRAAAREVQKEALQSWDKDLPRRFAEKFAPIKPSGMTDDIEYGWIQNDDGTNPKADKDNDGIMDNATEWINVQGKTFTYRMGENEVNELIRMFFGLSR